MNPDPLIRCTDCRHYRGMGTWCPEARKHAGGRWLRRCEHHDPETTTPGPAALRRLLTHPSVADVGIVPEGVAIRFHRHATSADRDAVGRLMARRTA